tara:strand:+ start:331 stop:648 length:318 start_codon:yes stop_codon:yes gene_type:complete
MEDLSILSQCKGFEWDESNSDKNWIKHRVSSLEFEQIFFNHPLVVTEDIKHSKKEKRYYALGHSNERRLLFVAFIIRSYQIRVISARDMNKKERGMYLAHEKENT